MLLIRATLILNTGMSKWTQKKNNQPFFRASSRKTRFSAKLPWKTKHSLTTIFLQRQTSKVLGRLETHKDFVSDDVLQPQLARDLLQSDPVVCLQQTCTRRTRINDAVVKPTASFKHALHRHSPLRSTCSTLFFTSCNSSSSLRAQRNSYTQIQQLGLVSSRCVNVWVILHSARTRTIVLPDPRGPTMSTELLSPWTAVLLNSSIRCLTHTIHFYNTFCNLSWKHLE